MLSAMPERRRRKPGYMLMALVMAMSWLAMLAEAPAYVLRGPHLLRMMADTLGPAKGLLVFQKQFFFDDSGHVATAGVDEVITYGFPADFRSEAWSDVTQRIHVVRAQQSLTVLDGQILSQAASRFDRYKDLLLYRSRTLLPRRLGAMGIDIDLTSLGRFDDKIAYIVGAQYPDGKAIQVWLDKASLLPLRWLMPLETEAPDTGQFEIRYLDWEAVERGWYPRRIEFYQNERLVREIAVESIQVNPTLSAAQFDLEALKAQWQSQGPASTPSGETETLDEVEQKIEDFKKKFD
jgi:hypothetical protein